MTRPIEFRFWDKTEKKYFETVFEANKGKLEQLVITERGVLLMRTVNGDFATHPQTNERLNERYLIEEFTGLKDKNGKKIFEGDIVAIGEPNCPKEHCEVVMENACWCIKAPWVVDRSNFHYPPLSSYCNKTFINCIEVIGSIHTTPELMKEGE